MAACQHEPSLAGNGLTGVRGRTSIEVWKNIEQTLRHVERIEIAVGAKRRAIRGSPNDLMAPDAQSLRHGGIGQSLVRELYRRHPDSDGGATDCQHVVPPEWIDERCRRDEEVTLAPYPIAPEIALHVWVRTSVEREGGESTIR